MSAEMGGREVSLLLTWTLILACLSALAATATAWLGSALIATPNATPRSAASRWLLALPAALTGATVGWAGMLVADYLGVDLDRTYVLTLVAHALLAYPFALRVLGGRQRISPRLVEDALLLGATERAARWRWIGRRTLMSLASAFLVAVMLSAGEVAATHLLTPREATPAALGLLREWVAEGAEGADRTDVATSPAVYALGAALAAGTVIAFVGAEWLRRAASRVEAG
jgi:ABC-type spermidine/putrescine transport system permease subunit II